MNLDAFLNTGVFVLFVLLLLSFFIIYVGEKQ